MFYKGGRNRRTQEGCDGGGDRQTRPRRKAGAATFSDDAERVAAAIARAPGPRHGASGDGWTAQYWRSVWMELEPHMHRGRSRTSRTQNGWCVG